MLNALHKLAVIAASVDMNADQTLLAGKVGQRMLLRLIPFPLNTYKAILVSVIKWPIKTVIRAQGGVFNPGTTHQSRAIIGQ